MSFEKTSSSEDAVGYVHFLAIPIATLFATPIAAKLQLDLLKKSDKNVLPMKAFLPPYIAQQLISSCAGDFGVQCCGEDSSKLTRALCGSLCETGATLLPEYKTYYPEKGVVNVRKTLPKVAAIAGIRNSCFWLAVVTSGDSPEIALPVSIGVGVATTPTAHLANVVVKQGLSIKEAFCKMGVKDLFKGVPQRAGTCVLYSLALSQLTPVIEGALKRKSNDVCQGRGF